MSEVRATSLFRQTENNEHYLIEVKSPIQETYVIKLSELTHEIIRNHDIQDLKPQEFHRIIMKKCLPPDIKGLTDTLNNLSKLTKCVWTNRTFKVHQRFKEYL